MLARELDAEIDIVNQVLLDNDVGAAIDINSIGGILVAVIGIAERRDVVDRVPADHAVACLVIGGVFRDLLEPDGADGDIVVVMNAVAHNCPVRDIAVE